MNSFEPSSHTLAKKTAYLFDTDFRNVANQRRLAYLSIGCNLSNSCYYFVYFLIWPEALSERSIAIGNLGFAKKLENREIFNGNRETWRFGS